MDIPRSGRAQPGIAEPAALRSHGARYCFAFVLCIAAAACSREPSLHVTARLTDRIYSGNAASSGPSTIAYPYVTLAKERRPVLSTPVDPFALLTRSHANLRVDVAPGSVLDFGFGVRIDGTFEPDVEFVVAATTDTGVRKLFSRVIASPEAAANVWHDARVELEGLSGPVSLSFSSQSAILGLEQGKGRAIAYFSEPVLMAPGRPKDVRRSVVLISLDTLSAKHLGMYGYQRDTSPDLDRLFSREGVIVDRFYANAVTTLPSHATMMTCRAPSAVLDHGFELERLATGAVTIAEAMRAAGYRTAAFTEDAWVSAGFGFHRGFETYNEETGFEEDGGVGGYIEQTLEHGLRWLQTHRAEPFFLFLHTYQVHNPYLPPQEYRELFQTPHDADQAVRDEADYDREIRHVDHEVADFITAMDRMGLRDDTVVIVTSDHGEEFGEHGRRYHGTTLHDETLHVPLLIRAPGLLPAGERRSGPMSIADLMPTVLGLLGLPLQRDCDGVNRAAHLTAGTRAEELPIFHEATASFALTYAGNDSAWLPPSYAVTLWPLRASRIRTATGSRCEMYDLAEDPGELTDLAARDGDTRASSLCRQVDDYEASNALKLQKVTREPDVATSAAPAQDAASPGADPLLKQRLEKLKALGYLQ